MMIDGVGRIVLMVFKLLERIAGILLGENRDDVARPTAS